MAVESGGSVLRATNPGWPDMEVTCTNETMLDAPRCGAVRRASGLRLNTPTPRHYPRVAIESRARRPTRAHLRTRRSGSDGALNAVRALWRQGLLNARRW